MKVLMLGHCSYFTIAYFTELLKKSIGEIKITVADPFSPDGNKLEESGLKIFDEVIHIPSKKELKITSKFRIKAVKEILGDGLLRRDILFYLLSLKFNRIKKTVDAKAESGMFGELLREKLNEYDVFHFHFAVPEFLHPLKFIPPGKVKIISIWGSDLFQTAGVNNYKDQLEAFESADYIILNTIEKREVFLSKFGRKFYGKTRIANFGLPEEKFEMMDKFRNGSTEKDFKGKFGINENSILIALGYNASPKQNHIDILEVMKRISDDFKKKIHLIIPMTYGLNSNGKDYIEDVRHACKDAGIHFTIFDKYISEEENAKLILSCDIKLNLRETDSMNAAMLESFYAGSILVNGAWHPYGKLRRLGIYSREIESLEELETLIPELIVNLNEEKKKIINNPTLIRNYYSSINTSKQWTVLYNEIKKDYNLK